MNPYSLIAYASLAISVVTAVLSLMRHKRDARIDLASQLRECQEMGRQLEARISTLVKENVELLRRLARLENGG